MKYIVNCKVLKKLKKWTDPFQFYVQVSKKQATTVFASKLWEGCLDNVVINTLKVKVALNYSKF